MNGLVKKAGLAIAMAATAVTGLTVGTAADAQRFGGYRGGYYGGYHGGYHRGGIGPGGAAVLGGLVGLGVGPTVIGAMTDYVFQDPADIRYSLSLMVGIAAPIMVAMMLLAKHAYRQARVEGAR